MKTKNYRFFSCDFETTVYEGQQSTEVWAAASVELFTEDVQIFHSIDDQLKYFKKLRCNVCAYYHNLKFDGSFWLDYLLNKLKFKQAYVPLNETHTEVNWVDEKHMVNNTFKYAISDRGQWYSIIIKTGGHVIELRDSLKLLPFSVKSIGDSFKTKHKKLDMTYNGYRYAGCKITDEERKYIANDVLVVKEALEIMFQEGHTKLTIGSCCLDEYKKTLKVYDYKELFPELTNIELDRQVHNASNVDEWVRHSYKGGWCYLVKAKAHKLYKNGTTADVNSLYPSMMSSESGNAYPVGLPHFWHGKIPKEAQRNNRYYFVRLKTRFYLKKGKLPFIQIKGNYLYKGTEALESSDVYDYKTEKYYTHYYDLAGDLHDTRVELTLTMTDYQLFKEHYDLVECEILDGCWFYSEIGIFDEYIEKYKKIKMNSKGAQRQLAKLFLNNLYGKMASSTDSSFKVAFSKPDGSIGFRSVPENDKQAGYIPVGSAITSYARNFTIRAAQKNYHGINKPGFIYADTDSIHCDLSPEKIKGIKVHETAFCCWALESCWDEAIFARQKTYVEHITHKDLQAVDEPYYAVTCAGMPDRCKKLFVMSLSDKREPDDSMTEEQKEFLKTKRTLKDFNVGLKVPGKLMPKRIPGGVLLSETTFEMR